MQTPKITALVPLKNHGLRVTFADGVVQMLNVTPYISGDWYEQLRDEGYFNAVRVIDGGRGISWPNGQDIAPHELYHPVLSIERTDTP